MPSNFIKISYIENGTEFDLIANIDDIARLSYGMNQLEFKTPFPNGERNVTLTQKEFDRLERILRKFY